MTAVRITKVEQHELGFWTANVTADGGDTVRVDSRIGCWTLPANPGDDFTSNRIARREVVPEIAAKLYARIRGKGDDTAVEIKPRRTFRDERPNLSPTTELATRMAQAGLAAVKEAA